MKLVSRLSQIEVNIRLLTSYSQQRSGANAEFAKGLIQRGICFVVVPHADSDFFAPSRFIGYIGNSRRAHANNLDMDGRETNRALSDVIGSEPRSSQRLERRYRTFCANLGIEPRDGGAFGVTRKFWELR